MPKEAGGCWIPGAGVAGSVSRSVFTEFSLSVGTQLGSPAGAALLSHLFSPRAVFLKTSKRADSKFSHYEKNKKLVTHIKWVE